MNIVKSMITGGIIGVSLALSTSVVNAQNHTNHAVTNTINGESQNTQSHQYIIICNNTPTAKNMRYSEKRRELSPFIDCLYEREIGKGRTVEDILNNAYELELQNPGIRDDIMKHMVAVDPIYVNPENMKYYHIINGQAVWKSEYIDVFIKRGVILVPESKAYKELRGE